jgi:exosome complex component RRP4
MRNVMQEGDMIVAEVQSLNNDRTVNLHTRNPKYGKLEPGTLVCLSHKLVKKQKHHMIQLNDVGMILGNNGNIWLSAYNRTAR